MPLRMTRSGQRSQIWARPAQSTRSGSRPAPRSFAAADLAAARLKARKDVPKPPQQLSAPMLWVIGPARAKSCVFRSADQDARLFPEEIYARGYFFGLRVLTRRWFGVAF